MPHKNAAQRESLPPHSPIIQELKKACKLQILDYTI